MAKRLKYIEKAITTVLGCHFKGFPGVLPINTAIERLPGAGLMPAPIIRAGTGHCLCIILYQTTTGKAIKTRK
jgi:hypothetical protein